MSSSTPHLEGMRKRMPETRAEQLRRAKRAQRMRERARGLEHVQLKLPHGTAGKLRLAMREPGFAATLDRLLDDTVVKIADFPALADIAWNLAVTHVPARHAFGLYERHWDLVDERRLTPGERHLIDKLAAQYGAGIIHA